MSVAIVASGFQTMMFRELVATVLPAPAAKFTSARRVKKRWS
jgi:hypothetical protein